MIYLFLVMIGWVLAFIIYRLDLIMDKLEIPRWKL